MNTETQQATGTSDNNKTNTSFDETVVSMQRQQATAENVDTNAAKKPVHGEDGECCGGCGG